MQLSQPEWNVAVIGLVMIAGYFFWKVLAAWFRKPVRPDPWGPEVAEALESPEATPICPHCQAPHALNRWFCPECGRAVGDYNNVSPYLYLFSMGELLRDGTGGEIRKSWLTVAGYLILSLAEYVVFAPIYWFFLFRNLSRIGRQAHSGDVPPVIAR